MKDKLKGTLIYRGIRYYIRKLKELHRTLFFNYLYESDFIALKNLKNKHKNKPCVLIGGGPSINKMDLQELGDFITIACNGFYLKMEELNWTPTYYTVEDPLPAEDNKEEISSLRNTIKVIPADLKEVIQHDRPCVCVT